MKKIALATQLEDFFMKHEILCSVSSNIRSLVVFNAITKEGISHQRYITPKECESNLLKDLSISDWIVCYAKTIILDYSFLNMSFEEFCFELCYKIDEPKAKDAYPIWIKVAKNVATTFTLDQITELKTILINHRKDSNVKQTV